jgi:hypothetical protein
VGWMHGAFQLDELVEQLEAPVPLLAKMEAEQQDWIYFSPPSEFAAKLWTVHLEEFVGLPGWCLEYF